MTCHFLAQVSQINSEKKHVFKLIINCIVCTQDVPYKNDEDDFSASDVFSRKVCELVCHLDIFE